jgi:hypothetical protein
MARPRSVPKQYGYGKGVTTMDQTNKSITADHPDPEDDHKVGEEQAQENKENDPPA